ncbi:putative MetA-pathway of phenol degradation [Rhodobiaceae bacterium]|nr:putative MetA-pathway of phenol degradation [Rhodobiaceae bacterium]
MKQQKAFQYLFFALLLIQSLGTRAYAAPQTFNTALPVAEDEFVFRQQFFYRRLGNDPLSTDRKIDVVGSVSVLGYGVTGNFSIFGVLPYLNKELDLQVPSGSRVTRNTTGIGDARLFGRYTVIRDNAPGRTFRIAPFAGAEIPTGDDNDSDNLGTLPATLQLGSGSWDPLGGVIVTYQTLQYQIDAQASYKFNTEANNFTFGDEARLDASLQYRLWPRDLGPGVPGFLYGVVEGNLLYASENKNAGIDDTNSGGTSFSLSPGVQYVTKRWIAETIIQVPLFQDLNGSALEEDFVVRTGVRVNF